MSAGVPGGGPRVVHVSYSDLGGGAAVAAWRLHSCLVAANVDSRMLVIDKQSDDPRVLPHRAGTRRLRVMRRWLRPRFEQQWTKRALRGEALQSLNLLPSGILAAAEALEPDIVHLHWLGFETASIEEIGRLRRPVVWTLHDMWAFSGASHYEEDAGESLWRAGAAPLSSFRASQHDWLQRSTWLRKARAWREVPFAFVTPSAWLGDLLARSALFSGKAPSVIPYALDLARFRPCDKATARDRLGLPADRPLIAFGAVGGLQDARKGGDLLLEAMRQLPSELQQRRPILSIFGQGAPARAPEVPVEIRWLGPIRDERLLPLVYSAHDVTVVPSVIDNLPQTGLEAQACGCPVVTFDATGAREVIEHQRTGYRAEAGSPASLAEGIAWVLGAPDRTLALGLEARRRAEALWSPAVVARAYQELYARLACSPRHARQ